MRAKRRRQLGLWRAAIPASRIKSTRAGNGRNVQAAPLYRRDLDLVAVAPDGELAAFCTVWFDDVTRTAAFEPVGTHPAHQRRGLGRAVMAEGLRRAARLGATLCAVGSYSEAAGALYASLGFTEYDLSEPWVSVITRVCDGVIAL